MGNLIRAIVVVTIVCVFILVLAWGFANFPERTTWAALVLVAVSAVIGLKKGLDDCL